MKKKLLFYRVVPLAVLSLLALAGAALSPGDRMALDVDSEGHARLAWADTRQHAGAAPEEDVYYAKVPAALGHHPRLHRLRPRPGAVRRRGFPLTLVVGRR